MGLLSNMFAKKAPFDADAAAARIQRLQLVLPDGAEVDLIEPDEDDELTYLITVVADRDQAGSMASTIVDIVSTGQERWSLELMVHDSADESSPYSSIDLPDDAVPVLDLLMRAHDELHPLVPGQTIDLDAGGGTFTIGAVPRGQALATARAAVGWWEALVSANVDRWSESSLTIDIGEGENAEITYSSTFERTDEDEQVTDAEWAQRVVTAWNAGLPALEAMLRLPVPAGHSVDFTFTESQLEPRLSVTHHETYDDDEDASEELVARIRAQVPDSEIKVL